MLCQFHAYKQILFPVSCLSKMLNIFFIIFVKAQKSSSKLKSVYLKILRKLKPPVYHYIIKMSRKMYMKFIYLTNQKFLLSKQKIIQITWTNRRLLHIFALSFFFFFLKKENCNLTAAVLFFLFIYFFI